MKSRALGTPTLEQGNTLFSEEAVTASVNALGELLCTSFFLPNRHFVNTFDHFFSTQHGLKPASTVGQPYARDHYCRLPLSPEADVHVLGSASVISSAMWGKLQLPVLNY